MKNPKILAGCAAALALFALCIHFGVRVISLYPDVREEAQRTASPTPVYGNVMVITPDPSAPTPAPVLRKGSSGALVERLQMRLAQLGYPVGEADGSFGKATEDALMAFQSQNGLEMDGVAGTATFAVLYSDAALPYVPPTPTPVPSPVPTPVVTQTPSPAAKVRHYEKDGMPVVVSRAVPLEEDYEPFELVCMNDYCDPAVLKMKYSDTWAEKEAVDALLGMVRAGISEGLDNWQISAAYRTFAQQKSLFDRRVRSYEKENGLSHAKAVSAARKTVADPGTSEHHLGVAFDITVPGRSFGSTPHAAWLAANAWKYGFIQRYTEEKKQLTGYLAEPWHYRYVGIEHSRIMQEEGLCLEEYLGRYGGMSEEEFVE